MLKHPSVRAISLIFTLLFFVEFAQARWATKEDASLLRLSDEIEMEIAADGTYSVTRSFIDQVHSEEGRQEAGVLQLYYNSQSSRLNVLDAYVEKDQARTPINRDLIQDKPLASSAAGFDQTHQVMVAFPNVAVGSRVGAKYRLEFLRVPFKGFFSESISFGDRYDQKKIVNVRSQLPLHIRAHDPEGYLRISESKEGAIYFARIELKRPVFRRVVDEDAISLPMAAKPWVDIASSPEWPEMVTSVLPDYAKILETNPPNALKQLARRAARGGSDTEIMNRVHEEIQERFRYLGDWRPINGGHVPRPLATIVNSGFGDCKDLSAVMVSVLRLLGYNAEVAFILRGVNPDFSPTILPNINAFNHAIVWAQNKAGQEFWLDPTNPYAFAQGVPEDLVNRPALLAKKSGAVLKRTPAALPEGYQVSYELEFLLRGDNTKISGQTRLLGRAALGFVGAALNMPKQSLEYKVMSQVADPANVREWSMEPINLKSRIARDLEFHYRFSESTRRYPTTAGPSIPLPAPWILSQLWIRSEDRASDLFLGLPLHYKRVLRLRPLSVIGQENLSCEINSAWVDFSRILRPDKNGIQILDEVRVKTSLLDAATIRSADYRQFQQKLRRCYDGAAIVYQP